jgi:hypothetical protein
MTLMAALATSEVAPLRNARGTPAPQRQAGPWTVVSPLIGVRLVVMRKFSSHTPDPAAHACCSCLEEAECQRLCGSLTLPAWEACTPGAAANLAAK